MELGCLIKELQKLEAEHGEKCQVVINGHDMWFPIAAPGNYDGTYEVLIHDDSKKPYYSVVGAERSDKGTKIVLSPYSIEDFLCDLCNCDTEIKYNISDSKTLERLKLRDDGYRKEAIQVNQNIEGDIFLSWFKRTYPNLPVNLDKLLEFFNNNFSFRDKLWYLEPEERDGYTYHPSYAMRREAEYNASIKVIESEGTYKLERINHEQVDK